MKKLSLAKMLALIWILRIIGFAVLLCGFPFLDYNRTIVFFILVGVGIVILFASVYIEGVYCRCPHCGMWIGMRNLPYGYCRHCGKELNAKPDDNVPTL